MGYRLRLTSLVLAGCLAASWDSWAQTGLAPPDVAALLRAPISLHRQPSTPSCDSAAAWAASDGTAARNAQDRRTGESM